MRRRCVVTGGAGFIGSHLVERLVSDGHEVVVVDDLCTGRQSNLTEARKIAKQRLRLSKAHFWEAKKLDRDFKGAEWVFHLAARADIVPSIQTPMLYHRSNVDGTAAFLEAARRAHVKRFIYAASSSCYGIPDQFPTPEDAPIRPMYPYALTKSVGEQYVLHWGKIYGISCISLRLFNVYGPRARTTGAYGAVMGVFLAQKLAGKPFTVVGDGTQTRDFTYVTDVADAFVRTAEADVSDDVFNVGSNGSYAIKRLVELLGGKITYIPKRPGEPDCTHADITKIKRLLEWEPKIRFEEGVKRMLDRIEDWQGAPVWDEKSIAKATRDWFRYLGTGRAA